MLRLAMDVLQQRTFAPEPGRFNRRVFTTATTHLYRFAEAGSLVPIDMVRHASKIYQADPHLVEIFVLEQVGSIEVISVVHPQFTSGLDEGPYLGAFVEASARERCSAQGTMAVGHSRSHAAGTASCCG